MRLKHTANKTLAWNTIRTEIIRQDGIRAPHQPCHMSIKWMDFDNNEETKVYYLYLRDMTTRKKIKIKNITIKWTGKKINTVDSILLVPIL